MYRKTNPIENFKILDAAYSFLIERGLEMSFINSNM